MDAPDDRPLLVLLHGYGADEQDLLPVADALGAERVLSLRGPVPVGPGAGWADGTRDEILSGARLDAAADAVLAELDLLRPAPPEVRLLGFSQGGALALTMLRRAPGRFRRVVLLSGFVPAGDEPGDAALAADPPAVFWGRGAEDDVIPPDAIERTGAWLARHADVERWVGTGLGHGVSAEELDVVRAFLAP